ncbi:D-amino-acid transaminase [Macrococcus equipercicus]|uniref:D-alanine aminotransferase n=1 Tax=Macrococcus equipercicus TaxID=69967 RepID=A0A9Q9BMF2_9STAP|nr:D-amino-acid transaminase [Macrococcus equipercicus]KAA1038397.1 D-amino-acid transaminase [Macrococcus equipercicus]UTH13215.1 D-amino-acid transaminase [Macrococcus equipercicus]
MTIIYYNGEFRDDQVTLDYNDRGYQFGDGIYEVVRVYDGRLFTAREHFERLVRSAGEILITAPKTVDEYIEICEQLIEKNQLADGNIYIQVTRGVAVRNHAFPEHAEPVTLMYTYEAGRPLKGMQDGVKVITAEDIRWLRCDIKSLNLLGNVLNKEKAVRAGAVEAVQIRDGVVTEGASSNVYIIKDGTIYTHPANNLILNGITRQVIKECAEELLIPFHEETFGPDELLAADEVFISSTTLEVTPVVQVDEKVIGGPGPVARKLQQAFDEKIQTGR